MSGVCIVVGLGELESEQTRSRHRHRTRNCLLAGRLEVDSIEGCGFSRRIWRVSGPSSGPSHRDTAQSHVSSRSVSIV